MEKYHDTPHIRLRGEKNVIQYGAKAMVTPIQK